MKSLENKTRKQLIAIIKKLEANGNRIPEPFPTSDQFNKWSMAQWEDKKGDTSGHWDREFASQRGKTYIWVRDFVESNQ